MEALEPVSSVRNDQINRNYRTVIDRIQRAAGLSGRDPESVRLVVVTKGQPVNVVQAVIAAGARWIGENYPEQAVEKISRLGPQTGVEWHMIGHIQSRKARLVCEHFSLVHSLDSLQLAQRLDECARVLNRRLPVLLEINLGGEESKFGWRAALDGEKENILHDIEGIVEMVNLDVRGLMAMPPITANPEDSRPFFHQLKQLQKDLSVQFPQANWDELSMGTSADYEIAVQEGATLVRVGQAVLGPRPARV